VGSREDGLKRRMSDAHERDLVRALGGRRTRGSGNQFANPMDGRHDRYEAPVAFAWDGKSTRTASITVTRQMWEKAMQQAHGERPMLALRYYDSDRLDVARDLVVISLHDLVELLSLVGAQ
jgi:hypothetical protein